MTVAPGGGRAREGAELALPDDARAVFDWLYQRGGDGQARTYSGVEIARGVFGRQAGPTPGVLFDPEVWPRVMQALTLLASHGLVEQKPLPQGDLGFRLRARREG